mmetsp:Transcript_47554/g.106842  ORF Transcript_47554/g.106842 Transcript_47554/m.106842 type:complete len:284 (+) Transcript_47554:47-898(+)
MLRFRAIWLLLTLFQSVAQEERGRREVDKTPHPCRSQYEEAEIQSWVQQHLEGVPGERRTPSLLLLLGGSGAGKGTFIDRWRAAEHREQEAKSRSISEFAFHGLDEYLQYVPEYQQSISDPEHVYKDAADACYGGAAIPAAKAANDLIISRRIDTIYEETGKNLDRIKNRVLPPFLDGGYRVTVVLVHNHADIAIERGKGRFQRTGRFAPEDYIRDTFKNGLESYKELKHMGLAAEFVYCANFESMQCWEDDGLVKDDDIVPSSLLEQGPARVREPQNAEGEL